MEATPSFTARRFAASSLPTFQLPPPEHRSRQPAAYASLGLAHPSSATINTANPSVEALSPVASVNSTSSTSSSTNGGPPFQPMTFWPSMQPAAGNNTTTAPPPLHASFAHHPLSIAGRPLYSPPHMDFPHHRMPATPTSADELPHPPFDGNLPAFQTNMSMSGGTGGAQHLSSLLHQHHHPQGPSHLGQSHQASPPPGPGPQLPEGYGGRAPPTPTYYTPTSTPQHAAFPAFTQPPPSIPGPPTTAASRVSPLSAEAHTTLPAPPHTFSTRPYSYPLPGIATHAPIMTNLHAPGSQMSLIGTTNHYIPPHMHPAMYAHHTLPQATHPQVALHDRPFKCDQCQQSFNRNHDLKRHKRIHLAVKPFPCGHCDKSFSRKDALKRHILVKGCGKSPKRVALVQLAEDKGVAETPSPVERSEDGESPVATK